MTGECVYVVIDAQAGFTSPLGSLSRAFGIDELAEILPTLDRLIDSLEELSDDVPLLIVQSEYEAGQFTAGDLNHPFAQVCVAGANLDCEVSLPITIVERANRFVKRSTSAMSEQAFADSIRLLVQAGSKEFVLCGFLYTSCVAATALEMRSALPEDVAIVVRVDLCGTRKSKFSIDSAGSPYEATNRLLMSRGIQLKRE